MIIKPDIKDINEELYSAAPAQDIPNSITSGHNSTTYSLEGTIDQVSENVVANISCGDSAIFVSGSTPNTSDSKLEGIHRQVMDQPNSSVTPIKTDFHSSMTETVTTDADKSYFKRCTSIYQPVDLGALATKLKQGNVPNLPALSRAIQNIAIIVAKISHSGPFTFETHKNGTGSPKYYFFEYTLSEQGSSPKYYLVSQITSEQGWNPLPGKRINPPIPDKLVVPATSYWKWCGDGSHGTFLMNYRGKDFIKALDRCLPVVPTDVNFAKYMFETSNILSFASPVDLLPHWAEWRAQNVLLIEKTKKSLKPRCYADSNNGGVITLVQDVDSYYLWSRIPQTKVAEHLVHRRAVHSVSECSTWRFLNFDCHGMFKGTFKGLNMLHLQF
jgi:hypothetical protein